MKDGVLWPNVRPWLSYCTAGELAALLWAIATELESRGYDTAASVALSADRVADQQDLDAVVRRYFGRT